jgi:hypothetical protein
MKKKKESKGFKRPPNDTCIYCGGKEFEHIQISKVGVVRLCKNCGEQTD